MPRKHRSPLPLAALPLVIAAAFTAVASGAHAARSGDVLVPRAREIGRPGGRFVAAQISSPRSFNPLLATESSTADVTSRLFASLVDWDPITGVDVPMLARSWEVAPDGRTWTLRLYRGAAFSDGHPITADDVVFSFDCVFDAQVDPPVRDLLVQNGRRFVAAARDSHTVVVTLPAPNPLALALIGSVRILPRHVLADDVRRGTLASAYGTATPPDRVVTSGPWRVGRHVPGERTVLVPNPHWIGFDACGRRLPYLAELVFLVVPDQEAAALRFLAGEVDALDNVKPEDYVTYERGAARGGWTVHSLGPGLGSSFFLLNQSRHGGVPLVGEAKHRWFSNRRFRVALAKAIDRDAMVRGVFHGRAAPTGSPVTAGNRRFHTGRRGWAHDPAGARALLDGLGWRDRDGDGVREDDRGTPIEFRIATSASSSVRVALMQFVREDLARIGVRCIPVTMEFLTLMDHVRTGRGYDAALLGLGSGVPPDPLMSQNVWRSSGNSHFWNLAPDPPTRAEARVDSLLDRMAAILDLAERRRLWSAIEAIVIEECWLVMLPVQDVELPIRSRFGNLEPTVIPHRFLWNADRIFVRSVRR